MKRIGRGEVFPLFNRSQMVSLSRADKKIIRDNNSNKTKMFHQIYLGGPLIYPAQVKSMCGKTL